MLHDIKDIFIDTFDIQTLDEKPLIISQLVQIVEIFNTKDIEANEKVMAWFENKFEKKLIEKFSIEIIVWKVELMTLVQNIEELVQKT